MGKNHMIISIDAKKAFDKIHHDKAIYEKPTDRTILSIERRKGLFFPQDQEQDKDASFAHCSFNESWKF